MHAGGSGTGGRSSGRAGRLCAAFGRCDSRRGCVRMRVMMGTSGESVCNPQISERYGAGKEKEPSKRARCTRPKMTSRAFDVVNMMETSAPIGACDDAPR